MLAHSRLTNVVTLVAIAVAAGACNFNFSRGAQIEPGSVSGRALLRGVPAKFARVNLEGGARVLRADADGVFVVRGLNAGNSVLRLTLDEDADGQADFGAVVGVSIKRFTGASGGDELTGVLLGDVALLGAAKIDGNVVDDNGAPVAGARVMIFRDAGAGVSLGDEVEVSTDADGAFSIKGVTPGVVQMWTMKVIDTPNGPATIASEPVTLTLAESDEVHGQTLVATPIDGTWQERIALRPPAGVTSASIVVRVVPEGTSDADIATKAVATLTTTAQAGASQAVLLPIGVYDVRVQPDDENAPLFGALLKQSVPPGPLDRVLSWGELDLRSDDPCVGVVAGAIDRDGDGAKAMPDPNTDAGLEVWQSCVNACTGANFAALDATCDASDGNTYDCDDDGDGQPDVTEPFACIGVCASTELDGDGLCDAADPNPYCASNDATDPDCASDAPFVPPPASTDVVGGEGEGEGEGEGGEGEGEGEGAEGEGEGAEGEGEGAEGEGEGAEGEGEGEGVGEGEGAEGEGVGEGEGEGVVGCGDGVVDPGVLQLTDGSPLPLAGSRHMIVADVNGDSFPDVVVAGGGTNAAFVLPGDGGGGFAAPTPLAADADVVSVATGDLDNDGDVDIVALTGASNLVNVYDNDGTGAFALSASVSGFSTSGGIQAAQPQAARVLLVDLDDDGFLNLVTADTGSFAVDTGLGSATGFGPAVRHFFNGGPPTMLASGDFDADGRIDIAAGTRIGEIQTVLNATLLAPEGVVNQTINFDIFLTDLSGGIAVGDFNRDGLPDLVSALPFESQVQLDLATAPGVFGTHQDPFVFVDVPDGAADVAVADIDGDGFLDLVVTGDTNGTVQVVPGNGNGTFRAPVSFGAALGVVAVAAANLRGAGVLDVVALETTFARFSPLVAGAADALHVLTNASVRAEACDDGNNGDDDGCSSTCAVDDDFTCTGTPSTCTALRPCGDRIVDVNGGETCDDGNFQNGDGCDFNCTIAACGNGVRFGNELCDDGNTFDGDGCDGNCTPTGCGNGALSEPEECDDGNTTSDDGCDANCTNTACGNGITTSGEQCDDHNLVDSDGCEADCTLPVCGNGIFDPGTFAGMPFTAPQTLSLSAAPIDVAVGDFNGDAFPDVAAIENGLIETFINDGSGAVAAGPSTTIGPATRMIAADLDNDQNADLVVLQSIGGVAGSILLGDGAGNFVETPFGSVNATAVVLSDVDGDSFPDVVVANASGAAQVSVFINNRAGHFTTSNDTSGIAGNFVALASAGDLDGDLLEDVVGVRAGTNDGSVLESSGVGLVQTSTFALGATPVAIALGEATGDSSLDAIVETNNNTLTVHAGSGALFADTGNASFVRSPTNPHGIAFVDDDGDGATDVYSAQGANLFFSQGPSYFTPDIFSAASTMGPIAIGDFALDRRASVVVTFASPPSFVVEPGTFVAAEFCDDQNSSGGDGCSQTCTVEPGFSCSGFPSTCNGP